MKKDGCLSGISTPPPIPDESPAMSHVSSSTPAPVPIVVCCSNPNPSVVSTPAPFLVAPLGICSLQNFEQVFYQNCIVYSS